MKTSPERNAAMMTCSNIHFGMARRISCAGSAVTMRLGGKRLRSRFLRNTRSEPRAYPPAICKRRTTTCLREKIKQARLIQLHCYGLVMAVVATIGFISPAGAAQKSRENGKERPIRWVWPDDKEVAGCAFKTFESATIKQKVSYLVWLPPGYDPKATQTRYPVIYFLHGGGGNYRNIPEAFIPQIAAAIKEGRMPPVIGVVVNGLGRSLYIDSADGETPVESIIIKELIPHIDATYLTDPKRRAIEGFSMGGYGATHLAFKYPDLFIGLADFAGAVQGWEFFGRVANLSKPWGGEERFLAEWPMTLARKNTEAIRKNLPQVFLAVGNLDTGRGSTLGSTTKLHQLLDELKIPNQLIVVPGVKHSYENLCKHASVTEKHIKYYAEVFGRK
jgi:S-formylglutathione hydrolase FrmB